MWEQRIAEARIDIERTRLLTLKAADMMDKVGNKTAQLEIAMIKVAAPVMALKIIDNAMQAWGGAGVSEDPGLARAYASIRTLRFADGPDEVHNRAIARWEIARHGNFTPLKTTRARRPGTIPGSRLQCKVRPVALHAPALCGIKTLVTQEGTCHGGSR